MFTAALFVKLTVKTGNHPKAHAQSVEKRGRAIQRNVTQPLKRSTEGQEVLIPSLETHAE